ncbi:MAG: aldehyde dehydrogenase (NADP(+)) [Terracidiphilus sp.]
MELTGQSFLGSRRGARGEAVFQAMNPQTGEALPPVYHSAAPAEVNHAAELAAEAFVSYSQASGKTKAAFLRRAADGFDAHREALAERAHLETGLAVAPRLVGEVARTAGQLRMFADVVEEGSWVQARIDPALPDRKPAPRVNIRSMLRPLGPVAVFGASNFPLAFSVAGGDTASALAAGCPVVVKAHPAHPGTSEMAAQILAGAVAESDLHPSVFSMLFDSGIDVGAALVRHPLIRAVGFTGSLRGGRALMDLAAARPDPIPCFTEMSSGNPVFVLPGAFRQGVAALAANLFGSVTVAGGQMCTKPGIVLLPDAPDAAALTDELRSLVEQAQPFTMLTAGIARSYSSATANRATQVKQAGEAKLRPAPESRGSHARARLFSATVEQLVADPALADEIFGPDTLLVACASTHDYLRAAKALDGHLTATILGTEEDLAQHRELVWLLEQKAGRLIFNGVPTGVEVSHAMVHGGPYPATSDSRFTSVGSPAIFRWARPVCFQNFPQALLPEELQDANPLGIARMVDGKVK